MIDAIIVVILVVTRLPFLLFLLLLQACFVQVLLCVPLSGFPFVCERRFLLRISRLCLRWLSVLFVVRTLVPSVPNLLT